MEADNTIDTFSENTLSDNTQNKAEDKLERANKVLDFIKTHSPISLSNLAREMDIPRTTIYYLIRDFEFSNLIKTKMIIINNQAIRMIYSIKRVGEQSGN